MRTRSYLRTSLAIVAVMLVVVAPGGALAPWVETVAAQTPAAAPADDGGWPRRYVDAAGGLVVLYEPQVASWENQTLMTLHAAVSHTPKGSDKPVLGTFIAEADTRVSVSERLVDFSSFRIVQSHFPGAAKEEASAAVAAIKSSMPVRDRVIALDRVLAQVDASQIRPKNVDGVKADPPVVFFSTRPAVVVNIDGDPIWSPIQDNDLRFAVNTNWDLFEHGPSKTFFLRNGDAWLKAASVSGPWSPAGTLPGSFVKLPADDNWKDVRAALPGRTVAASALPTVFVSTAPAELILLRGEPQYQAVEGTTLRWVSNTDADVFRAGTSGPVYYLVAGRWFSAPGFMGPWTFATLTLPADFAKIPLEHPRSRVLASVPGTVQAAEAVLLAQVPQTARVSKKEVKAPEVAYQGAPQFQPIEKTTVARAVNTDKEIIKVGDLYYLCFQGVWFMARTPTGPWEVTGSVPQQIYEIPVSSPAHSVTYVTVEDDDDDWVVYATAAAYTGMMVAWGCAVWGTGWYYPPYVGYGGFYPVYYPFYPTYGYGASYNPWTGAYSRGAAVYGPYGGAGVGARYNPRTGTYSRGAAAYGPYGARGAAEAYNPRTGTYAATRQGAGVYGSWGSTGVQRGDQWAATTRRSSNLTGNTTRVTRGSEGGAAVSRRGPQGGGFVGSSGDGDVYAGRDGNVYRKQGDSWQRYDNGSWNGVPQPTPQQREDAAARAQERAAQRPDNATMGQLDRDSAARSDGAQRARDASSARSGTSTRSTGSTSTGSYRPSGGGARAGGGVRAGGGRRR
jgi:hypothetical protein